MKISTVLCPTDFSACSDVALDFAIDLARRRGANIRLLHVFQVPPYVGWEDGSMAVASVELFRDLRDRVDEQLSELVERCSRAGVTATSEQLEGPAHTRIAELSAEVDLLVMGTHGRTGLPRLLLGSVAERVVRMAKCPVISVPGPEQPSKSDDLAR
jgi:nucleotide-binding universal stress UspA family protein